MKATASTYNYLQLVKFKSLSLWDVKRISINNLKANYPIVTLGDVIQEESKKYKIFEQPNLDFKILGVNNKIGLFDAYIEKGSKINQPYKKVEKGWLAYNPYRINVGSIGFKHDTITFDYISPAYIVFSCKPLLLPEFLYLLFKTETFGKVIRDNTTGSVRQNLSFPTLSQLKIPLPTINEQKEIIEEYNRTLLISLNEKDEVAQLEKSIEESLIKLLGINFTNVIRNKGLSIIKYSEITKWSVDYLLKQSSIISLKKAKYPVVSIGSILEYLQYGISEKCTEVPKGIPVLRMNNIQNRKIDFNELKYYEFTNSKIKKETVLLRKGDILFNRTNSKELVGKTAVFEADGEYTFASYLIRLRFKDNVNPYFINYLINSKICRVQIDLMSRQILGQANINSQELKEIYIPLPPLIVQNEIIDKLNIIQDKIALEQSNSNMNKKNSTSNIENKIFK